MIYYSFNTYLKERFGQRVQKVTLDAGLTCPNRDGTRGTGGCIYCDAKGSGTGAHAAIPDLAAQARTGMERLTRRYKAARFIVYFQSFCNTYAPLDKLKAMYDEVAHLPGIVGLSVATRPDCLSPAVLELLAGYAGRLMVWLELGLQSIHDTTLERINRGHTYKEFLDGYMLARSYPLNICLHMIIGLPGEARPEVLATAREVARLKPEGLKIHSLFIHRGTALENLYRDGSFEPISQQEFVQQACDTLEIIPAGTVIQRLTGDPDPAELVAPQWALQKNETRKMIEAEMKKRGSRQGKRWAA
ncbi:MAG: TIGR01212 family radical SAM protein [Proteobacteria bacterium]|nr:TIGR01212 family radical SAM protein [Pseudomonadota bacterium]